MLHFGDIEMRSPWKINLYFKRSERNDYNYEKRVQNDIISCFNGKDFRRRRRA